MGKEYSLDELRIGMEVYHSEISGIIGTTIYLDARTVDYSSGDPKGRIIGLGECPEGYRLCDMIIVNNVPDDVVLSEMG